MELARYFCAKATPSCDLAIWGFLILMNLLCQMKDFDLGICGLYVLSCDLGMGINLHLGREGVTRRFRMSQRCGAAVLGDAKR